MSIIIKGMEMPKSRGEYGLLLYVDSDGTATVEGSYCRFEGEPFEAVPVPPHGRLIDADAFLALINDSTILSDFLKCIINPLIRGEPTVIEAEEGE